MKYAGLIENDFINGEGVSISLFTQGCPFKCEGCFNPETWDPDGGKEIDEDALIQQVQELLGKNGIYRNLNLLGGEPLYEKNREFIYTLIWWTKQQNPESKIYLWTGYTMDQLQNSASLPIARILNLVDVIITGPYIQAERDITLPLRGSRNQQIWRRKDGHLTLDEN